MNEYEVVFDFKSTKPELQFELLKKRLCNDLVIARNAFSEEINKHLDEWNSEADKLHLLDTDVSDDEYLKFMHNKYVETLSKLTKNNIEVGKIIWSGGSHVQVEFYVDEDFQLHLKASHETFLGNVSHDVSFHIEEKKGELL